MLEQQQRLMSGQPLAAPVQQVVTSNVAEEIIVVQTNPEQVKTAVIKEIEETKQASVVIDEHSDVDINNLLLNVVSEKTGYPLEMLSLDMSLDTDLGIDSIKRVEILSALQEQLPWSQAVNPEELGTFQFLQHIVEFIAAGRPVSLNETSTALAQVDDTFAKVLLEIVSEKTGYPIDMLDLEMNLDSDLGIDSIKRVEILSAIQERVPELPAVSPDDMATLQTLQSIVDIFNVSESEQTSVASSDDSNLSEVLLEVVADKTGYPVDMLNLEMNLDSDLGIDSIKRVEILSALQDKMPNLPVVAADDLAALQTLQQIIEYMNEQISDDIKQSSIAAVVDVKAEEKTDEESRIIRSVVRLAELEKIDDRPGIDFNKEKEIWITNESGELAEQLAATLKENEYKAKLISNDEEVNNELGALIICAKAEPDKQYLLNTFSLIQRCSTALKKSNGILTSITTLGGHFGFEDDMNGNPIQAGLYGIIKTADKEWPEVSCKSIDINQDSVSLDLIQNELFLQGPLEVGLSDEKAYQLLLQEETLATSQRENTLLNKDDLIVISGGARGVTAEVAVKLAGTYQCGLLLLGRSPEPETEPEWLASFSEAASIKKAIMDNAQEKLRPADLEKRYQSVLANREIGTTLERIKQTGAKVQYASVDVTDADTVANTIDLARTELGNVTGIIHAAGVLADRLIEDKTEEQFNNVYSTKVEGLQSLLSATNNDTLKLIVLFSSTTARLGRKGQVDYAAANEILNKQAAHEDKIRNKNRKTCKVLSVNWGPWDGGMVTPVLKKLFAEEGVGVIGLKAGADYLIQEIESDGPVETVILAEAENILKKIPLNNYSISTTESSELSLVFERDLSVSSHAFLKSHVMNGQAVLPVSVIIEWFAHGALHLNPGMQFQGFDDFRILKGVTLKADEAIHLRILAGTIIHKGDVSLVPVELRSDGLLHASAVMILADSYETNVLPQLKAVGKKYKLKQSEYYQNGQLFHGQDLQGITEVLHCSDKGIVANVSSAPQPSTWMNQPIRSSWLTDPLILDSAFQMMILWSFEEKGIASLPTAITSYRQYQRSYPKDGAKIIAVVNEQTDHRANAAIEFIDRKGQLIALMDGYECVRDSSLQIAFKENSLTLET